MPSGAYHNNKNSGAAAHYSASSGNVGRPSVVKLSTDYARRLAAPAHDDIGFVFEDEDRWQQPLPDVPLQTVQPSVSKAPLKNRATSQRLAAKASAPKKAPRDNSAGRNKDWHAYLYVGIITVCFVCMCIITVMMMPQMAGFFWTDFHNFAFINGELLPYDSEKVAAFEQYRAYVVSDTIYPGVFVDGISVGGLTIEEAKSVLTGTSTNEQIAVEPYAITVAIGDKTWQIDQNNVPAVRNLGNVLERAYAIGRTNSVEIQATVQTPFRQRVNQLLDLRTNGINLTTDITYDTDAVRRVVDEITAYITREPVNAQILSFDYKTRQFTFSDDQPGIELDGDLLYSRILEALNAGKPGAVVTTNLTLTPAAVTKSDLSSRFSMIAAYTTTTTSESNRNTNIRLACEAINGTALMPGEVFSFNAATGQRTTDKGYRSAGAIAAGQSIEEVGGGICQVSSTLFNAVARADLEIVERSPHAWPSTYVNRGEDATVNWPNLDFKFRNNTQAPIFVITYYSDRKMSAEIWGLALKDGVTIELESKTIRTIEPSLEVRYEQNPQLPFGTSQTKVKARTGYVVETYKVWYLNGQEMKRELLHTSTYNAYQQVVEYN